MAQYFKLPLQFFSYTQEYEVVDKKKKNNRVYEERRGMSEIRDHRNRPTGDSDTKVIRHGLEKTEYV